MRAGEALTLGAHAVATEERLAAAVRRRARSGRLPCAAALALASELGLPPLAVGRAANELGIKIDDCQLGCFGHGKQGR